jgi:hypothetical protein
MVLDVFELIYTTCDPRTAFHESTVISNSYDQRNSTPTHGLNHQHEIQTGFEMEAILGLTVGGEVQIK